MQTTFSKFTSQVVHHTHLMINRTRISALPQNFSMLDIFWHFASACMLCLESLTSLQSPTLLPCRFVILKCSLSLIGDKGGSHSAASAERVREADCECELPARCSRSDSLIRTEPRPLQAQTRALVSCGIIRIYTVTVFANLYWPWVNRTQNPPFGPVGLLWDIKGAAGRINGMS